jgi:hypothetical protein
MSHEQGRNNMSTVHQPAGSLPEELPPPDITPLFNEILRQACAERGLPYEPWPLP